MIAPPTLLLATGTVNVVCARGGRLPACSPQGGGSPVTCRDSCVEAEGSEMRKLRSEMHRRKLGNGYCARPVGLDCHFESICESCTYFQTTLEFRPTLQRQRDDAAEKGQVGRLKIFDGLLERLDTHARAS
jgi:hypothetical protein